MALHRDIYWVGRQWAVTGYGIQACNQKQKSQFDIEGARLWEDGVLERLRAEAWLNIEDFEKAIEVARKYYPEPTRKAAKPEPRVPELQPLDLKAMPKAASPVEPPFVGAPEFKLRIERWPAKFIRTWRIRVQR